NTHTRRLALERAYNELTLLEKVESGPVQIRQRLVDQRRRVRRIGHQIALAAEQAASLLGQARVVACLVAKVVAFSCKAHNAPGDRSARELESLPPGDAIFTEPGVRAPLSFVRAS